MTVLAHGLGVRSDLPVPPWVAIYAGAFAVVVTFVALAFLWRRPTLSAHRRGAALPPWATAAADSQVTRGLLKALALAAFAAVLLTAWAGRDKSGYNPAPTWFSVWFWVGMVPVSVLFGPVYRIANPLRLLAQPLHRLITRAGRARAPGRIGCWPAILGLLLFLWLELVYPFTDAPRAIAVFITAYAAANIAAGAVYGPRWFARGDGFEVYFTVLGRLAPVGRRAGGALAWRNPLNGLLDGPPVGLAPVLLVILGATTFDGASQLPAWGDLTNSVAKPAGILLGTAGLLGTIALVAALYAGAMRLTRPYARHSLGGHQVDLTIVFAHILIPIALGYTVAHYFSSAVFQGQDGLLLATDPLGRGWDLLGTASRGIDYSVVSPTAVAVVQVLAIICGHILAVVAAHDRALSVLRPNCVTVGQFPTLALMVIYTSIGIALVSSG